MRTVAKTRERFVEDRLEALNEKPRPSKKPKLTGRDEAMLTAIAFSDPRKVDYKTLGSLLKLELLIRFKR